MFVCLFFLINCSFRNNSNFQVSALIFICAKGAKLDFNLDQINNWEEVRSSQKEKKKGLISGVEGWY